MGLEGGASTYKMFMSWWVSGMLENKGLSVEKMIHWAYVQFRGSEFHTRNARFRQPQEQRRAKAQR